MTTRWLISAAAVISALGLAWMAQQQIISLAWASQPQPQRMIIERIVPPGARLTYSVDGTPVSSIPVPPGRVRITVEYQP